MADDDKKTKDEQDEVIEVVEDAAETVKEAKEEVAEATEVVEKAEEAVKEAKEAVKEVKEESSEVLVKEEKKEEPKVEEKPEPVKKEKKPEPTGKFKELVKQIETMSVLELSELVKVLEDRFGVSAAAPVAMSGAAPAGAVVVEEEAKAFYNVVITNSGANKIGVIKAVREVLPDLGLKEAKDLVEAAPATVKENMKKEDAEAAKEKLTAGGATVELQ